AGKIVLAGLLAFASVCRAEMYYLDKTLDPKNFVWGLVSNEVWETSSGVECSEITSSDVYFCIGKTIQFQIDKEKGGSFQGGSLVIGSDDSAGAGLIAQKKGAALNFPDYASVECGGLVLKNGMLGTRDIGGTGTKDTLKGKITLEATSDMPFMIVDARNSRNIEINADFHGAVGSAIEFGSVFQRDVDGLDDKYKETAANKTLLLTGTFNNFFGTLAVTNKLQTASINTLGALNSYGSRLKLDTDSVFSGKMVVNSGSVLECTTAGKVYQVGGLELRPGSVLLLNGSTELDSRMVPSSTICASLRVLGECRATGPVMVALPGCAALPDGKTNRIEILTAASSSEINPDDFVLAGCGTSNYETYHFAPSRFVVESGDDGSKTLYCEFEPYTMLIDSDSTSQTSGNHPSAITNGASWSSGVAQAADVNYVVIGLGNTAMSLRSLHVNENGTYTSVFSGKRLIIAKDGKLYADCHVFKSEQNPLRIMDGGKVFAVQYVDVKFIGGVDLHRGDASMYMYTNDLDIDVLTGSGTFKAGCGSDNSKNYRGHYYLRNTERFMGTLLIQQNNKPTPTKYQALYVCNNALGGALPQFNPAALCLTDESALCVDASSPTQRLENVVNRGVFIDGEGRVLLEEAHEYLRIDWPISMNGELWKEGAGTLVLGGECLFGSTGAADPSEDTVADIHLKDGVLAVASVSAIDGCRLSISNGTSLAVAYSSGNNALLKYGLRNVKASEPFVLCDVEGGKLPLAVDFSGWGDTVPIALEVGLVTVDNQEEIVASVNSMMPETVDMLGLKSFYKVKISKTVNSDEDTVTFKAALTKVGFTVTVR
ncbi:MAG: hypothetical protein J6R18_03185, partial [Kiritimatiellae bacterium]|nr:hypothetical protein [Kiritimatiellia bacterium]